MDPHPRRGESEPLSTLHILRIDAVGLLETGQTHSSGGDLTSFVR